MSYINRKSDEIEISLPGSKSITARCLIAASLAHGISKIHNPAVCKDIQLLETALKSLEIDIKRQNNYFEVTGCEGALPAKEGNLFVENAGTAMRFLTALCTLGHGRFTIDGSDRMRKRPIGALTEALNKLGTSVSDNSSFPPVCIESKGLTGGAAVVNCKESSQFLSALLLVAPYAKKDVVLSIHKSVSTPYIKMTIEIMKIFGINVEYSDKNNFTVKTGKYIGGELHVEPDASSASYLFAAAAILPRKVSVLNLSASSLQGDIKFIEILSQMGTSVKAEKDKVTVAGTGNLKGINVDMRDTPDIVPALAAVAAFADSPTTIRGIGHLRLKESDRIKSIAEGLAQLGGKTDEGKDWIKIYPSVLSCGKIRSYNDHRIAMAFSVIGLKVSGVIIDNCECVEKSFPDFFSFCSKLS
ncbi:MAG: 3-phosphoshikimate 1-carboxyvinyltransferase [Planctomycetota bacterium]